MNYKSAYLSNDVIKCYYARTDEQFYNLIINNCYTDCICCDSGNCDVIDTYCNEIISVLSRYNIWNDSEDSKKRISNVNME